MNSGLPADKPASLLLLEERLKLRLSPTRWPKPECSEGEQCMICHALATLTAWEQAGATTLSVDDIVGQRLDRTGGISHASESGNPAAKAFDLGMEGLLVLARHEGGASTAVAPGIDWAFNETTYTFVRWFPGTPYNTVAGSVKADELNDPNLADLLPDDAWNPLNGQTTPMMDPAALAELLKLCSASLECEQSQPPVPMGLD